MKRSFSLLLASALGLLAGAIQPLGAAEFAQQEPAGFSVRFDGTGHEEIYDTATDAAGNVYVVGRFTSAQLVTESIGDAPAANFRFQPLGNASTALGLTPYQYLFVTKIGRDGQVIWQRSAGCPTPYNGTHSAATGVAVDGSGNVFVTGSISAPTRFGSFTVDPQPSGSSASYEANIFVGMLDADGLWKWVKVFSPTVYATDSGGQSYGNASYSYAYVRNGAPGNGVSNTTSITPRAAGRADGHALRLGPDGSVYIHGVLEYGYVSPGGSGDLLWMRFGGTGLTGTGRIPLGQTRANGSTTYLGTSFLAKLRVVPPAPGSPAGTSSTYEWDWMTPVTAGVTSQASGSVIAIDQGTFDSSLNGNVGNSTSKITDFVVDGDSVYLTGNWKGKNVLAAASGVTNLSQQEGFVARLDASSGFPVYCSGYYIGINQANNFSYGGGIAVDAVRNVYVTGATGNNSGIGNTVLNGRSLTNSTSLAMSYSAPNGTQNCFVAKLDASGNWQWAAGPTFNNGNIVYAHATSLSRDAAGALYVAGSVQAPSAGSNATATFGTGVVVTAPNHPSQSALAAYVAKLVDANNTRTWQWVAQTHANVSGAFTTPIMDTADVRASGNGTVYWAINSFNGGGAFAVNRSGNSADNVYDATTGRGAFVLPLLPEGPYLSPTFSLSANAICGQEIPPPSGVGLDQNGRPFQPEVTLPAAGNASAGGAFYWDTFAKKLYAVSPVSAADVRWPVSADPLNTARVVRRVGTRWPANNSEGLTQHLSGAGAAGNEPSVTLQPPGLAHTFAALLYQDSDAQISGQKVFTAKQPGYAVLLYTTGTNTSLGSAPVTLEVVRTRLWNEPSLYHTTTATIGTAIAPASVSHADPEGRNVYVVHRKSRIDAAGATPTYNFDTRLGDVIPVNDNGAAADEKLVILASRLNSKGVAWPNQPETVILQWPVSPLKIIIASGLGSEVYGQAVLSANKYVNPTIYHQPDPTIPGYNPNEEHALFAPPQNGSPGAPPAVFALRNDLNNVGRTTSQPYVLVRYQDPQAALQPKFLVYKVDVTAGAATISGVDYPAYSFTSVPGLAGKRVQAPYPLPLLGDAAGTSGSGDPYFLDRKNAVWARCAGTLVARYFYPLQTNFWYDLNGDGVQDAAATAPWLDRYAGTVGTPQAVSYNITWPTGVPTLAVGDTVTTARDSLPDIENMASAAVIFEQGRTVPVSDLSKFLVRILPYVEERAVSLDGVIDGTNLIVGDTAFPVELAAGGRYKFANLPFHLKARLLFDPINKKLIFTGYKDAQNYAGRPLLLLNVLADADRLRLLALDSPNSSAWDTAVAALYALARNPNGAPANAKSLVGLKGVTGSTTLYDHANALGPKALTAGLTGGTGYVTIVENNDPSLGAAPIALHIIQVTAPQALGEVKVVLSDNALDEKITLRHSLDFGGDPAGKTFEWWYQPATTATSPLPPNPTNPAAGGAGYSTGWIQLASGDGLDTVVIEGSGLRTLADSWVFVRYKGAAPFNTSYITSPLNLTWAGDPAATTTPLAAFTPGWIKRVLEGINPFEARVRDFGAAPTQTYSSFLVSAGTRYEGAVALSSSASNLNSIGLIGLYETVIRRGFDLSINGTPAQTNDAVNTALLLASTRISDFYMLLGNEAYADAQDPTVGFTSADGVGSLAPSIFAFQNQVPNLISEELALLRGRDDSSAGVGAAPVYNRLFWNFTNGLEGEPAYVQNYGITDQNADGFINEADARRLFPQGHGDAWGHYLTAVKSHYRLLRHPLYTWNPRSESTLIAGVAVEVDYADEQKFAAAAAARATAGAEIVNLTYRDRYVADPAGQWQGYRDANADRAWGVEEWSRRAGQGAFFDWAVANAILPAVHAHPLGNPTGPAPSGLQKIDRTTVTDLAKIHAAYAKVQAQMDAADQGLNPLGLTPGAIPFDIDPNFLIVGSTTQANTHFDQIFARAMTAVNNARGVFDYASELTNRLRQTQLSANQFAEDSNGQEFDFRNRLIEIFGYPYAGDIGGGKTYPTGYDGPDLYHYNYVPVTQISGNIVQPDATFSGFFAPFTQEFKAPNQGAQNPSDFTALVGHYFAGDTPNPEAAANSVLTIPFPVATASSWSFAAPASWGQRRAPGRLQQGISDMVRAEAELRRGLLDYNNHLANIRDQIDLLFAQQGIRAEQLNILDRERNQITGMNAAIGVFQGLSTALNTTAAIIDGVADGAVESIPKVVGLATDATSAIRGAITITANAIYATLQASAGVSDIAANAIELAKERVSLTTNIEIQEFEASLEAKQQIKVIEALLREEVGLRLDLFNLQQSLRDANGAYLATLAEGQRVLEERILFRRKVAGAVQQNRYQDMTFRLFRNDSLQKYRAAFDLAARYTYLAATAYDYETAQLGSTSAAGRRFLTDIVRERALGQFDGSGNPVNGVNGLSDPLARLSQNFAVLKGRLGINNPQIETGQFSLRSELMRILPHSDDGSQEAADADQAWSDQLQVQRVSNLWAVPEFRRFCRPFAPESAGAQPGLVISFSSTVTFGQNFFGMPLGGGDSSYDSSAFATKIASVGVWFDNYNGQGLSNTPRVYLVPAGTDILRTPNDPNLGTREFDVVDQAIPTPFPIGTSNLLNPAWIPTNDSVDVPFNDIRQQSRFRAYHDGGLNPQELVGDTRLIGRSVWNTKWMLIIPGGTLLNDPNAGLDTFIKGRLLPGSTTLRDGNGVKDIKLFFESYSYSGN